ncbi:TPA: rod shape-determining protein MreC [bacterium UBP9_UBA11836]|nr:rod shape-determining protein MreC [bacterium UBP9_UBA11836]
MRQIKYWLKMLFLLVFVCVVLEAIGSIAWVKTSALALSPVQKVVANFSSQIDDWLRGFTQFKALSEKNDQLEAEIKALRDERSRLLAYKVQNLRLQSLLELKAQLPGKVKISARVIARDPNNWGEKVVLDRGRNDGVTENMVAVTPEGLVGRVSQVGSRSCTLSLVGSESLAVPVALVDSEIYGIMRTNKMMRSVIKYIRFDVPIKPGQLVVTSGLGDVYPGGLAVGRVERAYVSQEAMYQDVLVKLSAELPRLREVILITKGDSSADPNIFKDAILRAEQEAKQAAKESAEAALRASNLGETPDNNWSDLNRASVQEPSTEAASSEPAAESVPSIAPADSAPAELSAPLEAPPSPSVSSTSSSDVASEKVAEDRSEPAASVPSEHSYEAPAEVSNSPSFEAPAQGAESHYITVEESEESAPEEPPAEEAALESVPTPNAVELEP